MAVAPTLIAGKLKEAILADMADDLQPYVDAAEDAAALSLDYSEDAADLLDDTLIEVAKVLGFMEQYIPPAQFGTTDDGHAIRLAGRGDNGNIVFGMDDLLRWFASHFYTPAGGSLTMGSDRVVNEPSNYAHAIIGPSGKVVNGVTMADGVTHVQDLHVYGNLTVDGGEVIETGGSTDASLLTRLHMKMMRRLMGDAVLATWAPLGDSWTDRALYVPNVARQLQARYGDGGTGFLGFANSTGLKSRPAATDLVADTKFVITTPVGTWAWNTGYTAPTANCCEIVSPSSGARVQIVSTSATINTVFKLLYRPIAGSSVRYSWDGGSSWETTLDLATGYVASLANVPATGAWTLLIEDNGASARCALTGILPRKASGALVHKVGSPGSTSTQWATQAVTAGFQAHWAELAPDMASILHGTNDQTVGTAGTGVAANYDTIAAGVRAAVPWANEPPVDLMYMAPAENLRAITPTMASYSTAIAARAAVTGAAFLDLQRSLGSPSATAWWIDTTHPHQDTGGPAMGAATFTFIDL